MPATLYTFKGIDNYGDVTVSDQLKANFVDFLNWGFLEIGAFVNVTIPTTTLVGGEGPHKLRAVRDPNFTNGRVWESQRMNWVYESGISYGIQPISVSGIYVNGTFYPGASTGTYAHIVDYRNGRIIFNTAIATSSSITCEYSYKLVNVVDVDSNVFKTIQADSFNSLDSNIPVSSGEWSKQAQSRTQLPCIGIDVVPEVDFTPKQLGGGQYKHQTIAFHVMAENSSTRNKLCDIITSQKDRTLMLYDMNKVADANSFALTSSGNLNSGGVNNYRNKLLPVASGGYQWKLCEIERAKAIGLNTSNSKNSYGLVYLTLKVDMPEI